MHHGIHDPLILIRCDKKLLWVSWLKRPVPSTGQYPTLGHRDQGLDQLRPDAAHAPPGQLGESATVRSVTTKAQIPAVEGWFTTDTDNPALLGSKCAKCDTLAFPKETFLCRNPDCDGREFEEVELSRRGRIWSFTNACYQPPPPYVPVTDPFEPFCIAAVELEREAMIVMGQMADGVDISELSAGIEVELVIETLFEDDENEHLVWRWKPVGATSASSATTGEGV